MTVKIFIFETNIGMSTIQSPDRMVIQKSFNVQNIWFENTKMMYRRSQGLGWNSWQQTDEVSDCKFRSYIFQLPLKLRTNFGQPLLDDLWYEKGKMLHGSSV